MHLPMSWNMCASVSSHVLYLEGGHEDITGSRFTSGINYKFFCFFFLILGQSILFKTMLDQMKKEASFFFPFENDDKETNDK